MRINEAELTRLAEQIVQALRKQDFFKPNVGDAALGKRIFRLFYEDMKAEEELELEAERLANQHAREMAGMDQRRIIEGIKARLAKERGFTL